MTTWTLASVFVLALIFWLNATLAAAPYVAYLAGTSASSGVRGKVVTALLLLLASTLYFFLKVGSFAGGGIMGMADTTFIQFIWVSPVGSFVQLQAVVAVVWMVHFATKAPLIKWGLFLVVMALMLWSFFRIGHGSEAPWWGKLAFSVHLLVAWLWFGSLNSLRTISTSVSLDKTKTVMERFGVHMSVAVPLLLIAGVVMYRSATQQWLPDFPLSSYDQALIAKLAFVALILAVSALHKFRLVPQLDTAAAAKRLKFSITIEMVFAISIFIMASALSSAFSPT